MFELTNDVAINLDHVSEITTHISSSRKKGGEERAYILEPKMCVTMTNGRSHTVEGLADVYNYCEKTGRKRLWNGLINKLNKELNCEEFIHILKEEDKPYFNLEV